MTIIVIPVHFSSCMNFIVVVSMILNRTLRKNCRIIYTHIRSTLNGRELNGSKIKNSIIDIRKRSGAVSAFCKNDLPKYHGSENQQNHSIGKWYSGEINHQKNHFAIWSNDPRLICLMNKRFRTNSRSTLNHLSRDSFR